jgi:hypothetical protein
MRQLRRSAGMDADRLRRVELDTVAPWQKHILDDAEDKLVLDQRLACGERISRRPKRLVVLP